MKRTIYHSLTVMLMLAAGAAAVAQSGQDPVTQRRRPGVPLPPVGQLATADPAAQLALAAEAPAAPAAPTQATAPTVPMPPPPTNAASDPVGASNPDATSNSDGTLDANGALDEDAGRGQSTDAPTRGTRPDLATTAEAPMYLHALAPAADSGGCTPGSNCPAAAVVATPASKLLHGSAHIGPAAERALDESHAWAENPAAMPSLDGSGRVLFPYSESAPTIVCAPLHVCDIELQAGEVIQGTPHIGDSVRWKIAPAISGTDEHRATHLIIKPTEAQLDTNLVIATDRHTYHIRLVSGFDRYVTSVGFSYPDEQEQLWKDFAKANSAVSSSSGRSADVPLVTVNRLNFDYKIKVVKGKPDFKPLRAMDDGYHTYIAMNEDLVQNQAPVLVGISRSGEEQLINYRVKGNLFVIDGTVHKMALLSGVGREQQRIELTRQPCARRGWLGMCWDAKE